MYFVEHDHDCCLLLEVDGSYLDFYNNLKIYMINKTVKKGARDYVLINPDMYEVIF
jgi:hypothetical protein